LLGGRPCRGSASPTPTPLLPQLLHVDRPPTGAAFLRHRRVGAAAAAAAAHGSPPAGAPTLPPAGLRQQVMETCRAAPICQVIKACGRLAPPAAPRHAGQLHAPSESAGARQRQKGGQGEALQDRGATQGTGGTGPQGLTHAASGRLAARCGSGMRRCLRPSETDARMQMNAPAPPPRFLPLRASKTAALDPWQDLRWEMGEMGEFIPLKPHLYSVNLI
jgi:hypothetical protein